MAFGNYGYNPWAQMVPQYVPQGYQQPQQQVQQSNGIIWVQGEAGAKAYPVAPGCSAFLMDSENQMAYLKTSDMSGMPSMRYYSVAEIQPDDIKVAQPTVDYATQDDIAKLRDDIAKLRKTVRAMREADDNA